ncbi:MAG: hypothetical protein HYS26_04085 [Candidatus Kaiserbacteria bacterium]|nr:MAG: hypothetical protein HYS26_04085 [Candidatus Kaiserbacteria bacterium]
MNHVLSIGDRRHLPFLTDIDGSRADAGEYACSYRKECDVMPVFTASPYGVTVGFFVYCGGERKLVHSCSQTACIIGGWRAFRLLERVESVNYGTPLAALRVADDSVVGEITASAERYFSSPAAYRSACSDIREAVPDLDTLANMLQIVIRTKATVRLDGIMRVFGNNPPSEIRPLLQSVNPISGQTDLVCEDWVPFAAQIRKRGRHYKGFQVAAIGYSRPETPGGMPWVCAGANMQFTEYSQPMCAEDRVLEQAEHDEITLDRLLIYGVPRKRDTTKTLHPCSERCLARLHDKYLRKKAVKASTILTCVHAETGFTEEFTLREYFAMNGVITSPWG